MTDIEWAMIEWSEVARLGQFSPVRGEAGLRRRARSDDHRRYDTIVSRVARGELREGWKPDNPCRAGAV